MTLERPVLRRLTAAALFLTLHVAAGAHGAHLTPLRIAATDAAPGSAVLELYADELVTMTPIPFRLVLKDAGGRAVTGARVSCDLTMPAMTMPENRPRIVERDGAYAGVMIFTCAMGAWRITCLAEQRDGSHRTVTFDIAEVRLK